MGDFIFDVIFFAARGSMPWAPTHPPPGGSKNGATDREENSGAPRYSSLCLLKIFWEKSYGPMQLTDKP